MRVISFVTQKGGAGKTTLAVNCAVAAEKSGRKTLILDLDPQGSAESWYQDREADTPRLVKIESWTLPEAIAKAHNAGYDLVMIDTPGRDEPSVTAAIRAADFCIIPCRPTPVDMKATPPTVATIARLREGRGIRADADAAPRRTGSRGGSRTGDARDRLPGADRLPGGLPGCAWCRAGRA